MAEDFTAVVGRELDRVGQDLGWSVFARNTSNSTMEDARKIVDGEGVEWQVALSDSLPSFSANTPFAVLAREQSAGRGRTGRTWSSAADTGLYATFVIFPHDQSLLEGLSLIVGVAIRRALQELGIGCGLKWPNDVVVVEEHGAFKKLAGVLIERFERSGGSVVSIGVGINTKQYAALEEVGGTSIEQQGGEVSVAGLLCLVVRHLGEVLAELAAGKRAELLERAFEVGAAVQRRGLVE